MKRESVCVCVRERGSARNTFEILHLLPFLSVALRVNPGLRVADLPRGCETRGCRGQQIAHNGRCLRTADKRHRSRRFAVHRSGRRNIIFESLVISVYTKKKREDIYTQNRSTKLLNSFFPWLRSTVCPGEISRSLASPSASIPP